MIISGSTLWTLSGGDPNGEWVLVTEVVDGDTIYVGRGWRSTKVRLIGVDTPETVHPEKPVEFFGPEASEFTKRQLDGKKYVLNLSLLTSMMTTDACLPMYYFWMVPISMLNLSSKDMLVLLPLLRSIAMKSFVAMNERLG